MSVLQMSVTEGGWGVKTKTHLRGTVMRDLTWFLWKLTLMMSMYCYYCWMKTWLRRVTCQLSTASRWEWATELSAVTAFHSCSWLIHINWGQTEVMGWGDEQQKGRGEAEWQWEAQYKGSFMSSCCTSVKTSKSNIFFLVSPGSLHETLTYM